jgi:amino acid transporter
MFPARVTNWSILRRSSVNGYFKSSVLTDSSVPLQLLVTMSLEAVYILRFFLLTFVFYCFGAILPIAGPYSILSLFLSGMLLIVFRPILKENTSAVPYNGGNYSYLVNSTSKSFAIVAATITLLDAITTVSSLFTLVNLLRR